MTFVDFCAGIGGGRLGLTLNGFEPLGFSEIDKEAIRTYKTFFDTSKELEFGNLTKIKPSELPNFDLIISGFPCQTFSIVGKRRGLNDELKGQIIYNLAEILRAKQPKFFIFENVKGLVNHDKGQTFKTIINLLEDCGYKIHHKVLNSNDFALPQLRERVYFIGFRSDIKIKNDFFENLPKQSEVNLSDFLSPSKEYKFDKNHPTFIKYLNNKYNINRVNLDEILRQDFLVIDTRQSDLRVYTNKTPTLRRDRQGLLYTYKGDLYKINGLEALKLQGFSKVENLQNKIKDLKTGDLLRQCGNAMSVNVIQVLGKRLLEVVESESIGSKTAKGGFKVEKLVVDEFNAWKNSDLAKDCLVKMGYKLDKIEQVVAQRVKGSFKTDVQVKITIYLKDLIDAQNISVKSVSKIKGGSNQVERGWIKDYKQRWKFDDEIERILNLFVGKIAPYKATKREGRMYFTEMSEDERNKILACFKERQFLIISDILKGSGKFAAEWFLVVLNPQNSGIISKWQIKPINEVLNLCNGEIYFNKKGGLQIGKISMQKKGGDGGGESAKQLQFKLNPLKVCDFN